MNLDKTVLVMAEAKIILKNAVWENFQSIDITLIGAQEIYVSSNGETKRLRGENLMAVTYALRWLNCPAYAVCLDAINHFWPDKNTSNFALCFDCPLLKFMLSKKTPEEANKVSQQARANYPDFGFIKSLANFEIFPAGEKKKYLFVKGGENDGSNTYSIYRGQKKMGMEKKLQTEFPLDKLIAAGASFDEIAGWQEMHALKLPLVDSFTDLKIAGDFEGGINNLFDEIFRVQIDKNSFTWRKKIRKKTPAINPLNKAGERVDIFPNDGVALSGDPPIENSFYLKPKTTAPASALVQAKNAIIPPKKGLFIKVGDIIYPLGELSIEAAVAKVRIFRKNLTDEVYLFNRTGKKVAKILFDVN